MDLGFFRTKTIIEQGLSCIKFFFNVQKPETINSQAMRAMNLKLCSYIKGLWVEL